MRAFRCVLRRRKEQYSMVLGLIGSKLDRVSALIPTFLSSYSQQVQGLEETEIRMLLDEAQWL